MEFGGWYGRWGRLLFCTFCLGVIDAGFGGGLIARVFKWVGSLFLGYTMVCEMVDGRVDAEEVSEMVRKFSETWKVVGNANFIQFHLFYIAA